MLQLMLAMFVATAVPAAIEVGAGPEPSPTPVAWELEFKYEHPQRIEIMLPGQATPTVYWYIVYTVTNPGQRTERFFPTFQLVTDDLAVVDTDMGILPVVFDAIKKRHRVTHPHLVNPTEAIGDLMAGDDHARESVAIWRADDLLVNSFTVYVAGLSGEIRFMPNPSYDPDQPATRMVTGPDDRQREETVNPEHFTLRKTLELTYELPGSTGARQAVQPVFKSRRWIMR
ncbi:MAG: hypothetical protein JXO22_11380 [Phycisphaerae bacterium]|nr:hypothetical protein [Phycisphaerae bacterium]